MLKSLLYLQLKIWLEFLFFPSDKRGIYSKSIWVMNVKPPETLVIIESIVYKSNGFAILLFIIAYKLNEVLQYLK